MRKLFVLLLAGFLIAGTAQAAQASSYSVSIKASRTTVDLGGTFKLSGKVSPSAKGKKVKIQRRYAGGSWKTIKNVKLTSHSTYSYTVKPTAGGPTEYRVSKAKKGKRHGKVSSTRLVNVWRWRSLHDFPDAMTYPVVYGTRTIGGQAFPNSVSLQGQETTWTFGTSARCTLFRTSIGVDDAASPGVTASPNFMWDHNILGSTVMFQLPPKNADLEQGQNPRSFIEPIPAGKSNVYVNGVFGGTLTNQFLALGTPQLYCNS